MTMAPEEPQYLAAHLRQALAEDPRTAEQGVRVHVRDRTVHLSGEVATAHRRDALAAVVAEHAPDMTIRNDVQVVLTGQPAERKELR